MKFLLLLTIAGLCTVSADFSAGSGAATLDQTTCSGNVYGFDADPATAHLANTTGEPAQLWDQFDGVDHSGFLTVPGYLELTVAVAVTYENHRTTITFANAADHSAANGADMFNHASAGAITNAAADAWKCHTCQIWDRPQGHFTNPLVPLDDAYGLSIDAGLCDYDAYGDCFAVFRYNDTWARFTTALGIGEAFGSGLQRLEYTTYNTSGPTRDPAAPLSNLTGSIPATAPEKFIEFCGEFAVDMREDLVEIGPFDFSTERKVVDRFVFCLVFQTRVEVATNVTIHEEPEYFQLLRVQDNAELNPDNTSCMAEYELLIITIVQTPYQLTNFSVDDSSYLPAHSDLAFDRSLAVYDATYCEGAAADADCVQEWQINYCLNECVADGSWNLTFAVECRAGTAPADCPFSTSLDPVNIDGTVTLRSASFCAVLIEAIDVDGSLESYSDVNLTSIQDNFMQGDSACFKGSFRAVDANGDNNTNAPPIAGVSVITIDLASFYTNGTTAPIFNEQIWNGAVYASDGTAPYTDHGNTAAVTPGVFGLNLNVFDATQAIEGIALGATAAPFAVANIGFCYFLNTTTLAPPEHGSFIIQTTVLVEVVFANTAKKLLELAYDYKSDIYDANRMSDNPVEFLQLQDGPSNLNEVQNTLGMFDPLPVENPDLPTDPLPVAKTPTIETGTGTGATGPVTGPAGTGGGGTEIWPIVAGVVGAVTVCIIVLLIALRRRRSGQKVKTVAVIPNTADYGKVAVVATESETNMAAP